MPYTVGIYTLGCKVSQYESIAIGESFEALGFVLRPFEEKCDVYVINTCTVTAESDRKCRQIIRRALGNGALVFVCGCYSQVSADEISKIGGVHYISGNYNKNAIAKKAKEMLLQSSFPMVPIVDVTDIDSCGFEKMQIHRASRTRVYIKIEDGCESHCTYCIIPKARGKIRSKAPEDIINEARYLASTGVKEVVLTGIETASYGHDTGKITLIDIIEAVACIDGIERIRLGSLDPSSINRDFVLRASAVSKLSPHFHLSMQSGSSSVLARMKRKYNAEQAMAKISLIREHIPNATFTTDMMVGFPAESESEFKETLDFVHQAEFLFIHVFPYSKRKGTPAAEYKGQIEESEKHNRVKRLCEVREQSAKAVREKLLPEGSITEVLFETCKNGYATGHSANFFEVKVQTEADIHGKILKVKIKDSSGETAFGELL